MSTKTTFKRIALVAVAALGLGVISVAPSSATVTGITVTAVNGTAATAGADSTTAAIVTVSGLVDAATDTIAVSYVLKSKPSTGTDTSHIQYYDTTTSANTIVTKSLAGVAATGKRVSSESITAGTAFAFGLSSATSSYVGGKFMIQLDSNAATTLVTGTYTYTVIVKGYSTGSYTTPTTTTTDVSIVVAATAAESQVVSTSESSAILRAGETWSAAGSTDSAVATLATASSTVKGVIRVINENAAGSAVAESITVTVTGPGVVRKTGESSAGKSIVVVGDGADDIEILSDGTAGTASIVVKTTSITYPAKTVTFFASAPSTSVASVAKSVIEANGSSTTDVVRATLNDSNGNRWAGDAYIYATSAASALVAGSETPSLCTFDAVDNRHECAVTGKTIGSATFKVISSDSPTATTTIASNEVTVRAAAAVPASFKLVFDKASYAPGEKAVLSVVPLDAAGLQVVGTTYTNLLAAGGITSSTAFSTGSDTLTATNIVVSATSSSTSGTTAGQQNYTVYMPFASGDVVVTATGGTGLPVAGRVAVTATATVVNSSVDAATDAANEATDAANAATDAALAAADAADAATAAAQDASDAVAALSASVSKLISSLRAQITSLTNLVIKIQKKVKA